ncbi:DEAD/DEAH box helicase family protein [Clostridium sp. KNHs216]|uniref:DEAD/DEAH box helicase family protein n=1 Tax=Clostridium sp. KNHs216 TaxID=1550235 RepID=UPI00116C9A30|nr:DEAD/DEAH box helicase family protein [Clostridium sp. KNHs216]TQI67890.1 superfamily II DNA or RNA helicase [Clostridium sp. KNHs216]
MSMLSDYEFNGSYNKLDDDVSAEFYLPCMRSSISYDRISGYFGSTVYIVAWDALKEFINNGGHIRVICSPFLSVEDAKAIDDGISAKTEAILVNALKKEIDSMLEMSYLSTPSRLLTCLIANQIVEIKIAIPRNTSGNPAIEKLYHDKAGIFTDVAGNEVAFRGSFNETYKGLSNDGNIESADVFQSWDGGKDAIRVKAIRDGFDRIWAGQYEAIKIYNMPDEVKTYVSRHASGYKWEELLREITVIKSKDEKWTPNKAKKVIGLKDHQTEALEDWEKQNYRAVYQGCTGCGKTVIAISAIRCQLDRGKTVLVLVPGKELLYHWQKEIARLIGDLDINYMLCGDGNNLWRKPGALPRWTAASQTGKKVIIAMMDTAVSPEFMSKITQGEHLFIIADEVHRMGSLQRKKFFQIISGPRFGVSATPCRYNDPEGTQAIFDYFGTILQPPYTLKRAIKEKVLTPYFYHPITVALTETEQKEWDKISKQISKLYASTANSKNSDGSEKKSAFLDLMKIERARIIKKAANKVMTAVDIIKHSYCDDQKWLVYCEDITQLTQVCDAVRTEGIDSYVYYSDMPGSREETLEYFGLNGGVLVSIRCLDEGVDIPSTTHAIVLASSRNPREFIQRRGRILRKADNKSYSELYDIIAVPNASSADADKSMSIIVSELARAIEFGTYAQNPACIADLKTIALRFGVDYKQFENGGFEEDEEQLK